MDGHTKEAVYWDLARCIGAVHGTVHDAVHDAVHDPVHGDVHDSPIAAELAIIM